MKKHTIIGTAGHIDHGKTALVKALTGIDADRLKEEKARGITIDIGFAYWRDDVTIIDVPGHEKFIRNMVAGVSTIDFFILVIAADDGIMPQTVEHLDILHFFDVHDGLVVINKIDLVDQDWLDLIVEETKDLLKRYGLENLPVFKVSSTVGENIDTLRTEIENKIHKLEEKNIVQPFRLMVDRSFTIKGYGTVVTGTVLSGTLHKGDEVDQMPQERRLKVRGIQTHVKEMAEVRSGFRAAVNLQGINKEDIQRGDVICQPGSMQPFNTFTGVMRTIAEIPVKITNRVQVHVYMGTAEHTGQMMWFEEDKKLSPLTLYHVRISLDRPAAAAPGDAFLVRLHSPVITLAGGKIIEIDPPRLRKKPEIWQAYFDRTANGDAGSMINALLDYAGLEAFSISDIQKKLFLQTDTIKQVLEQLSQKKRVRLFNIKGHNRYLNNQNFNMLTEEITIFISDYHASYPIKPGINRQELINGMKKNWVAPEILDAALQKLINSDILRFVHNLYAIKDFEVKISKDTPAVKNEILEHLHSRRFAPPSIEEMAGIMNLPLAEIKSVTSVLAKENQIILIKSQFFLHMQVWIELIEYLRTYFSKHSDLSVVTLKDFLQTTRKYAIPLLEHLDSEGYTRRAGDLRTPGHKLML